MGIKIFSSFVFNREWQIRIWSFRISANYIWRRETTCPRSMFIFKKIYVKVNVILNPTKKRKVKNKGQRWFEFRKKNKKEKKNTQADSNSRPSESRVHIYKLALFCHKRAMWRHFRHPRSNQINNFIYVSLRFHKYDPKVQTRIWSRPWGQDYKPRYASISIENCMKSNKNFWIFSSCNFLYLFRGL